MFYESYYWGMNLIWWIAWVILLFWIFAVPYGIPGERKRRDSPLNILQRRLVTGQITDQEYKDKRKELNTDREKKMN